MTAPDEVPGYRPAVAALTGFALAGFMPAERAEDAVLLVLSAAAPHVKAEFLADLADITRELAAENPQHAEAIGFLADTFDTMSAEIRKALT